MPVEQAVAPEVFLHALEWDGQLGKSVQGDALVVGKVVDIRRRQSGERVSDPDGAIGDGVRLEDGPHEDGGAAAPDAGLDQVARHAIGENRFDAGIGDSSSRFNPIMQVRPQPASLGPSGTLRRSSAPS